jgi:hypothetical protein
VITRKKKVAKSQVQQAIETNGAKRKGSATTTEKTKRKE